MIALVLTSQYAHYTCSLVIILKKSSSGTVGADIWLTSLPVGPPRGKVVRCSSNLVDCNNRPFILKPVIYFRVVFSTNKCYIYTTTPKYKCKRQGIIDNNFLKKARQVPQYICKCKSRPIIRINMIILTSKVCAINV